MAVRKSVPIIVIGAVIGALVGSGAALAYAKARKTGSSAQVSGGRRSLRLRTDPTNYVKVVIEMMVLYRLVADLFEPGD